jgi:phospholipid/cholesterol/gamma-HCH transport system substrate-binding protein
MSAEPTPSSTPPRHLERKAMALLLLVAALLLGFVLYVMQARGVFTAKQPLILIADDSEGVVVGMDLTFSGFPIGRVQRIELNAQGKARLVVEVPQADAHWLRTSSIFTMERGLVGDTHIRAYSGILSDPPLPAGAERNLLRGDAAAEIPRLVASTRELLENLSLMSGPQSSINQSLAHLQTVTDRLAGQYGLLGGMLGSDANAQKVITAVDKTNRLLGHTEQQVFGKQGLVDSTQQTLREARTTLQHSQQTVQQLNALLQDTRQMLTRADAVLAEAQAIGANVRVASTDLGSLRAEVEASLRKISQLSDELNRKWPFARDTEIKLP